MTRVVVDTSIVIDFTRAGELVRQNSSTQPMDAVIAASALESGAYLATGNRRHFSGVKGLRLFDSGR